MGEGTNATCTWSDTLPLLFQDSSDNSDKESTDDNLFSSEDESEEENDTRSISGKPGPTSKHLTTSGHKRAWDQTVQSDNQEVDADDNSWTQGMKQRCHPYVVRTFGMGFPKPVVVPLSLCMNRTKYFGRKWNPDKRMN